MYFNFRFQFELKKISENYKILRMSERMNTSAGHTEILKTELHMNHPFSTYYSTLIYMPA